MIYWSKLLVVPLEECSKTWFIINGLPLPYIMQYALLKLIMNLYIYTVKNIVGLT